MHGLHTLTQTLKLAISITLVEKDSSDRMVQLVKLQHVRIRMYTHFQEGWYSACGICNVAFDRLPV